MCARLFAAEALKGQRAAIDGGVISCFDAFFQREPVSTSRIKCGQAFVRKCF
jgi:hypothetical protein